MGALKHKAAVVGILWIAAALQPGGAARALDGKYVGSFYRTEGPDQGNFTRQLYEVGTQRPTPGGLDLRLRLTLNYQARPGAPGRTDLLSSRVYGDLRGGLWRLHGQLVPWQRSVPGEKQPRQRDVQLGLDLTPHGAPQLALNYTRLDRQTFEGLSRSEDRRAQLSYALGRVSSQLAFRRLDTSPATTLGFSTATQEWRGSLNGAGTWRGVVLQSNYDGLLSDVRARERRQQLHTQRVSLDGVRTLGTRVTLGGNLLERWGRSSDNAQRVQDQDIHERALAARAEYRPRQGLSLQAVRQYQKSKSALGDVVADYMQLEGSFRQALRRGVDFQTGYSRIVNVGGTGNAPYNSAYAAVDGALHRGVQARAELRAATASGAVALGTQWARLLQMRTQPTAATHLDLTWRKDTFPEVAGATQKNREWQVDAGWQPVPGASIMASARRLRGRGLAPRASRFASFTSSWRFSERSSLGVNWSRQTASMLAQTTQDEVTGVDLTFFMPGAFRAHGIWNEAKAHHWDQVRELDRRNTRSYGVSVDKSF